MVCAFFFLFCGDGPFTLCWRDSCSLWRLAWRCTGAFNVPSRRSTRRPARCSTTATRTSSRRLLLRWRRSRSSLLPPSSCRSNVWPVRSRVCRLHHRRVFASLPSVLKHRVFSGRRCRERTNCQQSRRTRSTTDGQRTVDATRIFLN